MEETVKRIVYVDMDNVLVELRSGMARVPPMLASYFGPHLSDGKDHFDDVPGIFALMDPMPGAVEAYRELAQLFDTYILSTAPWKNPSAWSDKCSGCAVPRRRGAQAAHPRAPQGPQPRRLPDRRRPQERGGEFAGS